MLDEFLYKSGPYLERYSIHYDVLLTCMVDQPYWNIVSDMRENRTKCLIYTVVIISIQYTVVLCRPLRTIRNMLQLNNKVVRSCWLTAYVSWEVLCTNVEKVLSKVVGSGELRFGTLASIQQHSKKFNNRSENLRIIIVLSPQSSFKVIR